MRVLNSYLIPTEKADEQTGELRRLRVAAYEYFKVPEAIEVEKLKKHKRIFWQDICLQRGWTFVDAYMDLLQENGIAWKERPDFDRLLCDCKDAKIDMVLTRNLSRFCPDIQACMETVRKLSQLDHRVDTMFLQEGVLCSVDQNMDILEQLTAYEKELSV